MDVLPPLAGIQHHDPKHLSFEHTSSTPSDPSIVLHKYMQGASSLTPPKLPSFSSVAAFVPNVYQRPQTGPWGAVPTFFPLSSSQIASARGSSASRMMLDQNANANAPKGNFIAHAPVSASPDPIRPLEPVPMDRIWSQDLSFFPQSTSTLHNASVPHTVEPTQLSPTETTSTRSEPILISSSSSDSSDSPTSGGPVRTSRRHTPPTRQVSAQQTSARDPEEEEVALAAAAAAAAAAMEKGSNVGLVGARSTRSSSKGGNQSSGYASGARESGYRSNGHSSNGSGGGNGPTQVSHLNVYFPVPLPTKRPVESPPDHATEPFTPGHNRQKHSGCNQTYHHHSQPNSPYFPASPFSGYATDSKQYSFMDAAGQVQQPGSPNGSRHPYVPASPGSTSGLENSSGYFAGATFKPASGTPPSLKGTSATPYDRFSMPLPPSLEAPLSKHAQRAQQNRIAQKAYRERKANYVRDLESRAQEAASLRKKAEDFEMEMERLLGLVRVVVKENERLRSGEAPEDVPRSVDHTSLDRLGPFEDCIGVGHGDQHTYEASRTDDSSCATAAEALHQMYHYVVCFKNRAEASAGQDTDSFSDGTIGGNSTTSLHDHWAPQKLSSHSRDVGNDSLSGGSHSSGSDEDKGQTDQPYGGRFDATGGFDERREPGMHGHGGSAHSHSHGHGTAKTERHRRAVRKSSESSFEKPEHSRDSAISSEERSLNDPPAEQERTRSTSGSGNESGPSSSGSDPAWSQRPASTAVDNEGDVAMDDRVHPHANSLHQITAGNSMDKSWLHTVLT